MFVAIVSFLVNLATAVLLILVTIADLSTSNFFSSFHFLKISFATNGPLSGWLNKPYDFISFGLWSFCEGTAGVTNACIDPKIGYTLALRPKRSSQFWKGLYPLHSCDLRSIPGVPHLPPRPAPPLPQTLAPRPDRIPLPPRHPLLPPPHDRRLHPFRIPQDPIRETFGPNPREG
ncbi:hypothetical protein K457DRAFT_127677 [Linnemannia elongata AG-77]|uniref:Uncharacterized protein n=1 Tax=Linnemannia elongata AG-77 TaxID=1314771 RepID=A0A197JRZ2_9FUNG|nr:hypothetical protein K457DRAFT_127677 [Linnemannia elongata AG-77]